MEEKMKQVLYKWLEIDLFNIAKKMGLSDKMICSLLGRQVK